ncbi:MAG: apolipoprotein N-acyltransferase [Bacteroidales bacterium]|nr:apolipoprotein N-acyltransferase [Bacteroidales bacterium]
MRKRLLLLSGTSLLSAVLLSLPFLVEGCSPLLLVGFVPLLIADALSEKRFFLWHYLTFVLWNAFTTFWVCNATVGGGIFAILANAFQMSLIFALFRWVKKRSHGAVAYIFLAATWTAWERFYLTSAQISWPWLVLGNGFAGTTSLVQWYEYTGTLGGSLWVWASNLAVFGLVRLIGKWKDTSVRVRSASIASTAVLLLCPPIVSILLTPGDGGSEEKLDVTIVQPNIDPYNKFGGMSQAEQNTLLLDMAAAGIDANCPNTLVLAPETFTWDIVTNDIPSSPTFRSMKEFVDAHEGTGVLFGAATRDFFQRRTPPSMTARQVREGVWRESHNSALIVEKDGRFDICHKSKLVPGVESTPYPRIFVPLDDLLGGVMGRDIGQKEVSLLNFGQIPVGCAICYESIYGEYCAGYIRKGARLLTVITNDAWWGDTPGYHQHLNYSRLRAIETRRWIARCANTGISAIIDSRGKIVSSTSWWVPEVLKGSVSLCDGQTFFVRHGDIAGRISVLVFAMILLAAVAGRFRKE